ncbi:MAG: hypothetical protein ACXWYO_00460 [Gaiellaceae bacterium]
MSDREQVVVIAAAAASFTVVCEHCAELDAAEGSTGSTFAGRLDLDLRHGTFLCRRGHSVRVERADPPEEQSAETAATAA